MLASRAAALCGGLFMLAGAVLPPPGLAGQSTLERTPNLAGGWVGEGGTIRFHVVHRFDNSGSPERQVGNRPTFLLAYAIPPLLAGVQYATRSSVQRGVPNEWELFARATLLDAGAALVSVTGAYNEAARAPDGELSVRAGWRAVDALGSIRLLGGTADTDVRTAAGVGLLLRLHRYAAASFDVVSLVDRASGEDVAWGAGLQLAVPRTPHTLSLQATNTGSATLRGSSVGENRVRYGFEFTVPITLSRFFGSTPPATSTMSSGDVAANGEQRIEPTFFARIHNLAYAPDSITVPAGTTIVWTNEDPVEHTVTARDGSWNGVLAPGVSWRRRFDEPGRYEFLCTPHPFMTGVVIVQ